MKRLLIILFLLTPSAAYPTAALSPSLQAQLDSLPMQGVIETFLVVKNRAPIGLLKASLPDATRQKLHTEVVSRLKETAVSTQHRLRQMLASEVATGRVLDFKGYWIDNLIFVRCTKEALLKLAERNDVSEIFENPRLTLVTPTEDSPVTLPAPTVTKDTGRAQPNLVAIGCRQAWKRGLTGKGRLICTLDTGIDGNHRAFRTRWRGRRPGVNHEAAWFDPVQNLPAPHIYLTNRNHGTHVLGIICGLDTTRTINGTDTTFFVDTIGVAPEAEWISAAVIDNGTNGAGILDALQWAADPDGDPNTTEDVPDVVNNSWAYPTVGTGNNLSCNSFFWRVIDNLEAAGAMAVFAAGNRSHVSSRSIGNPADRGSTAFSNFAVGNFNLDSVIVDSLNPDSVVRFTGSMNKSSCIGPTECGPDSLKPEVSAPGTAIYSAFPFNQFGLLTGTSMSAPHVAGAVALLRQYNPNATVDTIKWALANASSDIAEPGPDTISGFGLINIAKALSLLPPNQGIHLYVKKDSLADLSGSPPYAGGTFNLHLALASSGTEQARNVRGQLQSLDTKSTVLIDSGFFESLWSDSTLLVNRQPFQIQTGVDLVPGEPFRLALNLTGENGFAQTFNLVFVVGERLAKSIYHHRNGNIEFTVSNFGQYGFESGSIERRSLPGFDAGLGFERKSEPFLSRLFEASFMVGLNDSTVSNSASNEFCCYPDLLQAPDADFAVHPGGNLQFTEPGPSGGSETFSIFDDRMAKHPLELAVTQKSYSFAEVGEDNFSLLEFTLKNEGTAMLDGLRAGLFFDFNFFSFSGNYLGDKVGFDRGLNLGYEYNESSPAYRGIAVVDSGNLSAFRGVRNETTVYNGFTLAEKWQILSGGFVDTSLTTVSFNDADRSILAGQGPFAIPPGDSVKIAFALMAATTLDSLRSYTQTARMRYQRIISLRGDLNGDRVFSPADIVLELRCVFLSSGTCPLSQTDLDCSGMADITDVVALINRVFLGAAALCP